MLPDVNYEWDRAMRRSSDMSVQRLATTGMHGSGTSWQGGTAAVRRRLRLPPL